MQRERLKEALRECGLRARGEDGRVEGGEGEEEVEGLLAVLREGSLLWLRLGEPTALRAVELLASTLGSEQQVGAAGG